MSFLAFSGDGFPAGRVLFVPRMESLGPPIKDEARVGMPGDIWTRLSGFSSSSIILSSLSVCGGLLGGNLMLRLRDGPWLALGLPNPGLLPQNEARAAGIDCSKRRLVLDVSAVSCGFDDGAKNIDLDADGGGPAGVVEGTGSIGRRSGVEGGSDGSEGHGIE
jgi:hypothetical protein